MGMGVRESTDYNHLVGRSDTLIARLFLCLGQWATFGGQ